jgi:hypothetical protein
VPEEIRLLSDLVDHCFVVGEDGHDLRTFRLSAVMILLIVTQEKKLAKTGSIV